MLRSSHTQGLKASCNVAGKMPSYDHSHLSPCRLLYKRACVAVASGSTANACAKCLDLNATAS